VSNSAQLLGRRTSLINMRVFQSSAFACKGVACPDIAFTTALLKMNVGGKPRTKKSPSEMCGRSHIATGVFLI
jgi:hypothetical protein